MDLLIQYFEEITWEHLFFTTLRILLVVALLWAAMIVVKILLRRLEQRLVYRGETQHELPTEAKKRAETLVRLLRQGVIIVLWVMGLLIVLREIGVEIAPVLASVGVASLAIGFGAQNLVKDIIAGFFMILENQVRVGDVAVVNGTGGLVEQINFRTIVLRDLQGTVHVFPNGNVNTLSNLTQEWSAFVFDIGVAYKEDVDHVIEIMKQVGEEMRGDHCFGPLILADIEIFGLDNFADSAVVIKGRIKTLPIKQWEVGREYRKRLKKVFDRERVEIPFPQRTLHFDEQNRVLQALADAFAARAEPGRR